jgi:hypothetical protein
MGFFWLGAGGASPVMGDTRWRPPVKLVLLALVLISSWADPQPLDVATPKDTLREVGRRLSRSRSASDLSRLALDGRAVLKRLLPPERASLALGYLRFKVDEPVVVDVAVPARSVPFWLADQGFRVTALALENPDTRWKVFRKACGPGWIGLGVNGLDRTTVAHYVAFIRSRAPCRSRPGQTSSAGSEQLEGRSAIGPTLQFAGRDENAWKATVARAGVSAAHDVNRPFRQIPDELMGATLLRPAHAMRHSVLLATGRVWKSHVASTREPDQVTISFGADPARELVWTWRSCPGVASTSLRIAPACSGGQREFLDGQDASDPAPGSVRTVTGESASVDAPNVLNDPVTLRHRVLVTGLEPDSTYRYSLRTGTPERWGPWQTVKTAPERTRRTRFIYLGDPQTGLEAWGKLLQSACQQNNGIDFIVIGGDLVDRGNERTNWDHFFLRASAVFARLPLMPCAGNHEYLDAGPRLYRSFFELPRNGPAGIESDLVYHFECGDAFFAVLDSTLATTNPLMAQIQAEWLDAVLGQTEATWKFVIFHHPVYPSHPWRDTPVLRERWVPIFDKNHVDFVLQGHDHAYLRTYPMHAHRRVGRPSEGTIYIIAVSGDKYVQQPSRDYIQVGKTNVSTYQTIEIDAASRTLTYQSRSVDGTVVDELRIQKTRPASAPSWSVAKRH